MKDHKNDFVQFCFSILMNKKEISIEPKENQVFPQLNFQSVEKTINLDVDGRYSIDKNNSEKSKVLIKQQQFESSTSEDFKPEMREEKNQRNSQKLSQKEPKYFICAFDDCGKRFDYKWILDRHINSHFCFKLYKCEYTGCEKAYKSRENLNLHIKNKHLGEKPYQCSYCISRFSHRNGKTYHERKVHINYLPHKCIIGVCDLSFASKSALSYHVINQHKEVNE